MHTCRENILNKIATTPGYNMENNNIQNVDFCNPQNIARAPKEM